MACLAGAWRLGSGEGLLSGSGDLLPRLRDPPSHSLAPCLSLPPSRLLSLPCPASHSLSLEAGCRVQGSSWAKERRNACLLDFSLAREERVRVRRLRHPSLPALPLPTPSFHLPLRPPGGDCAPARGGGSAFGGPLGNIRAAAASGGPLSAPPALRAPRGGGGGASPMPVDPPAQPNFTSPEAPNGGGITTRMRTPHLPQQQQQQQQQQLQLRRRQLLQQPPPQQPPPPAAAPPRKRMGNVMAAGENFATPAAGPARGRRGRDEDDEIFSEEEDENGETVRAIGGGVGALRVPFFLEEGRGPMCAVLVGGCPLGMPPRG